jgi:hypothetical protein
LVAPSFTHNYQYRKLSFFEGEAAPFHFSIKKKKVYKNENKKNENLHMLQKHFQKKQI